MANKSQAFIFLSTFKTFIPYECTFVAKFLQFLIKENGIKMIMSLRLPSPPEGIVISFSLPEVFQSRQDFEALPPTPPLGLVMQLELRIEFEPQLIVEYFARLH